MTVPVVEEICARLEASCMASTSKARAAVSGLLRKEGLTLAAESCTGVCSPRGSLISRASDIFRGTVVALERSEDGHTFRAGG